MPEENQKEFDTAGIPVNPEEQETEASKNTPEEEQSADSAEDNTPDEEGQMADAIAYAEEGDYEQAAETIREMEQENADKKEQPFLTGESGEQDAIARVRKEELSEYKDKEGIEVYYDLREEEISPAIYLFQKMTIFRRNLVYSAVLAVIIILDLISVIMNPYYTFGIFMMVVALTVMGFLWYLPYRHRKSTSAAMGAVKDTFKVTFYDDSMLIGEGEALYRLRYKEDKLKAVERNDMLLIFVGKEKFFALSFRCIGDRMEEIRPLLQNALGENYLDQRELSIKDKATKPKKAPEETAFAKEADPTDEPLKAEAQAEQPEESEQPENSEQPEGSEQSEEAGQPEKTGQDDAAETSEQPEE